MLRALAIFLLLLATPALAAGGSGPGRGGGGLVGLPAPQTAWHYAPNGNCGSSCATFLPGAVGFNLADVSSVSNLNALPAGVKGIVFLGYTAGADATFQALVTPFIGNAKVFAFYIADEPSSSSVPPANLKAEADWIHTNDNNALTFLELENEGTPIAPVFGYYPSNTDIDLFGLDPYPVRPPSEGYCFTPLGYCYETIGYYVTEAESLGITQAQIIPTYQAFGGGGYPSWTMPTAAQLGTLLQAWAAVVPSPVFDYAYSWGSQLGDQSLAGSPALQSVFQQLFNSSKP